jgi:hypothetical protein
VILRVFGVMLIGALVLAAAEAYLVKAEVNAQARNLARLRAEVHRLLDDTAASRAELCKLDNSTCFHWLRDRDMPGWRE